MNSLLLDMTFVSQFFQRELAVVSQDLWRAAPLLVQGFGNTVLLAFFATIGALVGGCILGITRFNRIPVLAAIATLYIEGMRSIPLILVVILMHYGVMPLLSETANVWVSAWSAFVLFESAYVAEIVRAGMGSLRQEERETAISLGLDPWQRYGLIYFPLLFSRISPALISQVITLLKDTSLASTIGIIELTRAGEIVYEQTYHTLEILILQAMAYFGVCYALSLLGKKLERVALADAAC
jgi:His/Glu/Gln/Arg/opine family amino acid ABC transporter permease subunit